MPLLVIKAGTKSPRLSLGALLRAAHVEKEARKVERLALREATRSGLEDLDDPKSLEPAEYRFAADLDHVTIRLVAQSFEFIADHQTRMSASVDKTKKKDGDNDKEKSAADLETRLEGLRAGDGIMRELVAHAVSDVRGFGEVAFDEEGEVVDVNARDLDPADPVDLGILVDNGALFPLYAAASYWQNLSPEQKKSFVGSRSSTSRNMSATSALALSEQLADAEAVRPSEPRSKTHSTPALGGS